MNKTETKPDVGAISKHMDNFARNMHDAHADGSFVEYVIAMSIVVAQLHKTTIFDTIEAKAKRLAAEATEHNALLH